MPKIKSELTWGDILTTAAFITAALGAYYGIRADVAAEASARTLTDTQLTAQIRSNSVLIGQLQTRADNTDEWRSEHQREFDQKVGGGSK